MRLLRLVILGLTVGVMACTTSSWALTPYPFENYSEVPDGQSAPFVGNWSVKVAGGDTTVATCVLPLQIEATGAKTIIYRAPSDPEAEVDLVAENRHTTWRSGVKGGGFIAVWIHADSFYLYDQEAPDLGGPYTFTRCD